MTTRNRSLLGTQALVLPVSWHYEIESNVEIATELRRQDELNNKDRKSLQQGFLSDAGYIDELERISLRGGGKVARISCGI